MVNLSFKAKLAIGFAGPVAFLILATAVTHFALVDVTEQVNSAHDKQKSMTVQKSIEAHIAEETIAARQLMDNGNDQRAMALMDERRKQLDQDFVDMDPLVPTAYGKKLMRDLQQEVNAYQDIMTHAVELQRSGHTAEGIALLHSDSTGKVEAQLLAQINDMIGNADRLTTKAIDEQTRAENHTDTLNLLFALVGLVLGSAAAYFATRILTRGISSMIGMIGSIAEGNLTQQDLEIAAEDEIGEASRLLNKMKNDLRATIQDIAQQATSLAQATEELSAAAEDAANGAQRQHTEIEQISTAMHQMSTTVNEVSHNSQQAATGATSAGDSASVGGELVNHTVSTVNGLAEYTQATTAKIEGLGKSSREIGKIITVIDDIADQTNLLALNAAIEAARAGEQGRGFAVVADEVRKLAERTSTATKEIAGMIESIQRDTESAVEAMEAGSSKVSEGVSSASNAGEALQKIIEQSQQVRDMITQIASAATEQAAASDQIKQNILTINSEVERGATGAQQSASACHNLAQLAHDLQQVVARFHIDERRSAGNWNQQPAALTSGAMLQ